VSDVTQRARLRAVEGGNPRPSEAEKAERPEREELTIDQLAQRTGMTVRNIRAHQSRGLLPPPEVRGRTGYYGPEHIARIELIRELQEEGFNLEAIKRLLEASGGRSIEVLRFTRAVREPFEEEQPEILTAEEIAESWGGEPDPKLFEKAVKLGLLRPLGDGRFEQLSPRLGQAGDELRALGMSVEEVLDVAQKIRRHADGIAEVFVKLYLREVWKSFKDEGAPAERWPEVRDALERLRPLAVDAVMAIFPMAMSDAVDKAFGRELDELRKQ
jgi:DNA-binding transcriptional MerR regulator